MIKPEIIRERQELPSGTMKDRAIGQAQFGEVFGPRGRGTFDVMLVQGFDSPGKLLEIGGLRRFTELGRQAIDLRQDIRRRNDALETREEAEQQVEIFRSELSGPL